MSRKLFMPNDRQLDAAIKWLESDDLGNDKTDCQAVADWLVQQQRERTMRVECRLAGVPVAKLRQRIKERSKS